MQTSKVNNYHSTMVNKQYSTTDLEAFMKIAANWQNSNHILEPVDIKGGEMQPYMNNPAMNMYKKRERTQNWNHQEKKFLLDLCRKDMRIIENKRLDAGLTAVKNKAWKIIHQKFSNAFGTDRTCNRLKEQWRRMKACTRNEIMDYNNRLARFGADIADRKKPSSFTFEVWDFMQEAKKACKSEALDGIDYSKMPLALEEGFEYREDEHNNNQDDENDMENSRTPPQDLCDVDIKEETNDDIYNDSLVNGNDRLSASPNQNRNNQHQQQQQQSQHLNGDHRDINSDHHPHQHQPHHHNNNQHHHHHHHQHQHPNSHLSHHRAHSPPPGLVAVGEQNGFHHNNDHINYPPAFNMNNISATLEALNALRSGQFPAAAAAAAAALQNNFAAAQGVQVPPPPKRQRTSSGSGSICGGVGGGMGSGSNGDHLDSLSPSPVTTTTTTTTALSMTPELRAFMDMQNREHYLRMKILEVQLQAAKFSRDIVEINKTIALQKLQEFASKR